MSNEFPELDEAKVKVDESTKDLHMMAISRAITAEAAPRRSRLRLIAVATATVLLVPVMALAAERAVPGDFLYPVKQVFEPVVAVFDSDVAATHRVEEVELLYERDAPSDVISDHVDVARDAVTDHDPDRHLTDRIERVVSDLAHRDAAHDDRSDEPVTKDDPASDHPDDRATSTTIPTEDATRDQGGDRTDG